MKARVEDRRTHRPGLGLTVMVLGTAIVTITLWLKATREPYLALEDSFQLVVVLSFVVLGALTLWRRPENRMSWLFAWVGLMFGLSLLTDEYGTLDLDGPALGTIAAWISSWLWVPAFGPLFTLMMLWFPTGSVPSPRWKAVERLAVALIAGLAILVAFGQDPESTGVNPLAVPWVTQLLETLFVIIGPLFPLLVAACVGSLVVRFRTSTGEQRQQLKWFVLAAGLVLVYMVGDTILTTIDVDRPDWFAVVEIGAFLSLPAAAGVAILKYRLYDIDVVINRTLVYGLLTAALLASYLLIVFTLSRVLDPVTRDSDVAIAASTLAVAALFRPLRTRFQGFIDRRFYRSKYDAARALEGFGARLRDEIEVDVVRADVLGVVRDTLQPSHASVWIKPGEAT